MNRIVALAACGLLFAAGEGRAQHALDPHLRHAEMLRRLSPAPPAEARPALPGHIAGRDPLIADGVAVIARVGPAGVAAIEGAGGVVRARVGDIVTATLPASSLHALASTSAVRWLEAALPLAAPVPAAVAPLLPSAAATTVLPTRSPFRLGAVRDAFAASASIELAAASGRAAAASGLDRLRQLRDDRFLGLTGAGVIIGIFDSGLDLEHPDFRDDDGATRVLWAWDQAAPDGVAPGTVGAHDFGYGRECTAADIDTGICPLRDLSGHGTHVLGVAAGGGRGSAQRVHAGAAPHADLIVVKGGDAGFTTDRVLDGVVYMVERATQLGRPLVITLALSTQSGPHDGTTLFEQALDALSAAGRVIVTVAGNHGDNRNETPPFVRHSLHAMGTAPAVHELVVPPYTPQPGAVTDAALIELWYDGGDELAVTVVAPGGESARAEPGDTVVVFTADGTIYIDNAFGGPRPNGDNSMLIAVFDGEEERPPSPGRWRIELERVGGSAALAAGHHLWLVASTIQNVASPITLAGGTTNTHLVSVPGTATRLITATAYATRFDWLGPDGTLETYPFQEELGDLAQFSSPGPRRDGVLKPDIAAPGKLLLAPRSRDAGIWAQLPWMIDATGRYAALLGTSMAAPHVAGVSALLLQLRPDLTAEAVKALLGATAAVDGFTGRGYQTPPAPPPNVHWGAGKLDALAAVRALGHPAGAIALTAQPAAGERRVSGRAGTRIDLLHFEISADTIEPVDVERLGIELSGQDTAATLRLVVRDGADAGAVVASRPARLDATPRLLPVEGPVLARGETRRFTLQLELSGTAPHGSLLIARFLPAESLARGVLSGAALPLDGAVVVAAEHRELVGLDAGTRWSLSENPVRSERLVLNFDAAPRRAAVYTLGGALVTDLTAAAATAPVSISWPLTNDAGYAIASGVYLLVLDFEGERVLRRLFVLRRR